jgi:hypothetical protein
MHRFFAAVQARLVDDWHQSLNWGSVRLHLAATAVAVFIADNPNLLSSIVGQLPDAVRLPALIFLGALWAAAGWGIRVWRGKQKAPTNGK